MKVKTDRQLRPKVVLVNRAIITNKRKEILIIKRVACSAYMPCKWELPGGKLDVGQDISNALEREVLEETGLVVIPIDKVAYWHSEIVPAGKYKGLPYIVLVGVVKNVGGRVSMSKEHRDFKWLPVRKALQMDLTPESRSAISVLVSDTN
jgi:8-oxo-dGTP diphosphatase